MTSQTHRVTNFVSAVLALSGVLAAPSPARAQSASSARTLVIGVLSFETGESTASDTISQNAERGLAMGIEESRETARLFDRDVREARITVKRGEDANRAARAAIRGSTLSALIVTNRELIGVARHLALENGLLFMLTLPSAEKAPCSGLSFTLYGGAAPLDSMRASGGNSGNGAPGVLQSVSLWHPTLEKFGARELNDRYRSRWHTGMGSEAWAAWMAVKVLAEASIRKQTTKPAVLAAYIDKAEFDGHKGWPLSFRSADHLMRQPYYIVMRAGSSFTVQQIPEGDRSATKTAAEVLDELDPPEPGARCRSVTR